MFGDSAGWAAVAAGLPGSVERHVEGAVAEPSLAAEDEAAGVVRARSRSPGGGVTIFALLAHRLPSWVVGGWLMRGRWRWR